MKNRRVLSFIIAVSVMFLAENAFADWSYDITTDYLAGDPQAVFNLNLSTDEDSLFAGSYHFEFLFDNTELSYVDYTHDPLPGFFPDYLAAFSTDNLDDGELNNFTAGYFSPVQVAPGDYQLGSFTFDVLPGATQDGLTDFNFNPDHIMFGYITGVVEEGVQPPVYTDLSFADSHFTDVGASPVPTPSALLLLGSGIAGMAWFRRKKV